MDVTISDAWKTHCDVEGAYDVAHMFGPGGSREVSDPRVARILNLPDGFRMNVSAVPVTQVINRLICTGFTTENEAAQEALAAIVETNKLVDHMTELALDMCGLGDGYLLVWPGDPVPMVRVCDPRSTRILYAADDDHEKVAGYRFWSEGKAIRGVLYTPMTAEHWISLDNGKRWQPYSDSEVEHVFEHGLGQVPLFHARSQFPYGSPEHIEAYGAQMIIDKSAIAHAASIDFMGWPQIYALYEADKASGTDDLGALGAMDITAPDGDDPREEVSGLRFGPANIWGMMAKSVGQFEPADPQGFINTLNKYSELISILTGTPSRFFSSLAGNHPSGDALRAEDAPYADKIKSRRGSLNACSSDALEAALSFMGISENSVATIWKADQVAGDQEFWNGVAAKQSCGVPVRRSLIDAGYSDQDVTRFEEEADGGTAMLRKAQVLSTVAEAINKLSAASTLGNIDPNQIARLIDSVLGDAVGVEDPSAS